MKAVQRMFRGSLIALSGVWWWVDRTDWSQLDGLFAWRTVLTQFSGVLGIGVMSLAMLLSVRPVFLETRLDGLDKMYRLHKWLGIAGLVTSVSHWLITQGPKWLIKLGMLDRPVRPPRLPLTEGSLEQIFHSQRGLAESIGEWAFYIAAVLMVLALVKRFPYRRFFQTHRILALTYLALVAHSVLLLKFDYWNSLLGLGLAVLMASGSLAAVMSLLRKRAGGVQVRGRVVAIEHLPALGVVAVDLQLDPGWCGHQAGQFAFVTFHDDEGPHPFTIASGANREGRIRFIIKALGDYTRALPGRLRSGDPVRVEGPYGRFNFDGDAPRQIWIGGGIGITPFIARMQQLAGQPDGKAIDLIHTTAEYDQPVIDRLTDDAARAGVSLHVLWDRRDGRLDPQRLVSMVPAWCDADVWFCGPAKFGLAIRDGLVALGFPPHRFHQELFEMR